MIIIFWFVTVGGGVAGLVVNVIVVGGGGGNVRSQESTKVSSHVQHIFFHISFRIFKVCKFDDHIVKLLLLNIFWKFPSVECLHPVLPGDSLLWLALLPGQVVAPVPDIENCKYEREEDPGKDVYLLCLELEVLYPERKLVRSSHWYSVMNNCTGGHQVGTFHSSHQWILTIITIIIQDQIALGSKPFTWIWIGAKLFLKIFFVISKKFQKIFVQNLMTKIFLCPIFLWTKIFGP